MHCHCQRISTSGTCLICSWAWRPKGPHLVFSEPVKEVLNHLWVKSRCEFLSKTEFFFMSLSTVRLMLPPWWLIHICQYCGIVSLNPDRRAKIIIQSSRMLMGRKAYYSVWIPCTGCVSSTSFQSVRLAFVKRIFQNKEVSVSPTQELGSWYTRPEITWPRLLDIFVAKAEN